MIDQATAAMKKMLAPIARRVGIMVLRGVVSLVDDSNGMQMIQSGTLSDVERDDIERFQQFGFTSVPANTAECIVVNVGGDSDHPIAIAVDDRSLRPTGLSEGECAMYTKQDALRVYCDKNGNVLLGTSPSNFVSLANLVATELNKAHTLFQAITTVLGGAPIPEPGMGSPSALQTALNAAITGVGGMYSVADTSASQVKAK